MSTPLNNLLHAAIRASGASTPPPASGGGFAVDLWLGDQNNIIVNNGFDFSTVGGLVWIKGLTGNKDNALFDVPRGADKYIVSNFTSDEVTDVNSLVAFTASGYSLGSSFIVNQLINNYVGWSFLKGVNFFDAVAYTGDGSGAREVAHSLTSAPGMVVIKNLENNSKQWRVQHRSTPATTLYDLAGNGGAQTDSAFRNEYADAVSVKLSAAETVNENGVEYIAYFFGHDPAPSGNIQCGTYVGNGNVAGPVIALGYNPSYVMIKSQLVTGSWAIVDSARGMGGGLDAVLLANTSNNEFDFDLIGITGSGFQLTTTNAQWNAVGADYIYMAVREFS